MPNPASDQAFYLGLQLRQGGRVREAQFAYESALAADPNNAAAMVNLGSIVADTRNYDTAMAYFRKAAALVPQDAGIRNNIANCLWRMMRLDEARTEINAALKMKQTDAGFWHNAGLIEHALGHTHEALKRFDRSLAIIENPEVRSDRSMCLLAINDTRAWEAYDIRWHRLLKHAVWQSALPRWRGEDIAGKHIYVHAEQGLGDSLQFCRFLPLLLERTGCRITFGVQKPLLRLMQLNLPGIEVADTDAAVPESCDFYAPLLDLPGRLGIAPGSPPPFQLRAPLTHGTLPEDGRLKVGVVWAGSPGYEADFHRSMPFRFITALANPKNALYSLQVGPRSADIADHFAGAMVRDLSPLMTDFAVSAALISQLDAVVAVDTSTLHVVAACGVPTLAILPYVRCWRWLRGRDDSPWYPSLRIVQQKSPGDWAGVMGRVKQLLSVQSKRRAA